ncbi:von Willebrand factor type C domain protein [Cooperia oncophora]
MFPERCLKAQCSVVFHPECPADSRQVILPPPPGECCGRPGTCHCDLQKCEAFVPVCEEGMERVLVKEGGNQPGSCCDVFECRKREVQCESFRCPTQVFDEDEGVDCPPDSIRPAEHVPPGMCCPIRPGCRCRAAVCRPAVCDEGKRLNIIRKGTGTPGRCCDEWTCEDDPQLLSKSCIRDGKTYSDGQEWHTSSCEVCRCKKGVAVCSKMTCPKTPGEFSCFRGFPTL